MTVSTFPARTGIPTNPAQRLTYAQAVALTSVPTGYELFITDWGATGTKAIWSGTRWLPANGQTVLKRMGAAVSGIANVETIATQVQMPIGALQAGDAIYIRSSVSKSGTTDSLSVSFRVGTAGTTADTALTGLTTAGVLFGTSITSGPLFGVRVLSNTSMQRMGTQGNNASSYGTAATSAIAAATTGLADLSANAVWLTFTVKSSGATDTVGIQELTIIHEAG